MFDKQNVLALAKKSKTEGWPYPKVFQALVEAGVESYDVDVETHEIIYHGAGQSVTEEKPADFKPLTVAKKWDPKALQAALERNRVVKVYETFLKDAAAAGVHSYHVNMPKREITYRGKNPGEEYTE